MIVSNLSGAVLVLGFRALGPLWHLWGGFDSTVGVPGAWWTSKLQGLVFVNRHFRVTGKRWIELGGVVCLGSEPQGAV